MLESHDNAERISDSTIVDGIALKRDDTNLLKHNKARLLVIGTDSKLKIRTGAVYNKFR